MPTRTGTSCSIRTVLEMEPPLLATKLYREGLDWYSPHGFGGNDVVDIGRPTGQFPLLIAAILSWIVVRYAQRSDTLRSGSLGVVRFVWAAAVVAVACVFIRTSSRPEPEGYVDGLPARVEVFPMPGGPPRYGTPDYTGLRRDKLAVSDFMLDRSCSSTTCVVTTSRPGSGPVFCGVQPFLETFGTLVLREDVKHGWWFFDGPTQLGPDTRGQLGFRQSDLRCILPTDYDVAESVRPPARWFVLASAMLAVAGLLLALRTARRPAFALFLTMVALVPLLPWLI